MRLDPPVETGDYKMLDAIGAIIHRTHVNEENKAEEEWVGGTKNKKATIKRYRPIMAFFKL